MSKTKHEWVIGRYINGVTLNPLEYLLNEDNEPKRFVDEQGAIRFIVENKMGSPEDYEIVKLEE